MKSRKKVLEEEAKQDPNYRPTEELEVDESQLSEEEKGHVEIPLTAIIIIGILILLIIACIIVIAVVGNSGK